MIIDHHHNNHNHNSDNTNNKAWPWTDGKRTARNGAAAKAAKRKAGTVMKRA